MENSVINIVKRLIIKRERATYTQVGDSMKTTTTIVTKTVEEYQGVKK